MESYNFDSSEFKDGSLNSLFQSNSQDNQTWDFNKDFDPYFCLTDAYNSNDRLRNNNQSLQSSLGHLEQDMLRLLPTTKHKAPDSLGDAPPMTPEDDKPPASLESSASPLHDIQMLRRLRQDQEEINELKRTVDSLMMDGQNKEIALIKAHGQVQRILLESRQLAEENDSLRRENADLKKMNSVLRGECEQLLLTIENLKKDFQLSHEKLREQFNAGLQDVLNQQNHRGDNRQHSTVTNMKNELMSDDEKIMYDVACGVSTIKPEEVERAVQFSSLNEMKGFMDALNEENALLKDAYQRMKFELAHLKEKVNEMDQNIVEEKSIRNPKNIPLKSKGLPNGLSNENDGLENHVEETPIMEKEKKISLKSQRGQQQTTTSFPEFSNSINEVHNSSTAMKKSRDFLTQTDNENIPILLPSFRISHPLSLSNENISNIREELSESRELLQRQRDLMSSMSANRFPYRPLVSIGEPSMRRNSVSHSIDSLRRDVLQLKEEVIRSSSGGGGGGDREPRRLSMVDKHDLSVSVELAPTYDMNEVVDGKLSSLRNQWTEWSTQLKDKFSEQHVSHDSRLQRLEDRLLDMCDKLVPVVQVQMIPKMQAAEVQVSSDLHHQSLSPIPIKKDKSQQCQAEKINKSSTPRHEEASTLREIPELNKDKPKKKKGDDHQNKSSDEENTDKYTSIPLDEDHLDADNEFEKSQQNFRNPIRKTSKAVDDDNVDDEDKQFVNKKNAPKTLEIEKLQEPKPLLHVVAITSSPTSTETSTSITAVTRIDSLSKDQTDSIVDDKNDLQATTQSQFSPLKSNDKDKKQNPLQSSKDKLTTEKLQFHKEFVEPKPPSESAEEFDDFIKQLRETKVEDVHKLNGGFDLFEKTTISPRGEGHQQSRLSPRRSPDSWSEKLSRHENPFTNVSPREKRHGSVEKRQKQLSLTNNDLEEIGGKEIEKSKRIGSPKRHRSIENSKETNNKSSSSPVVRKKLGEKPTKKRSTSSSLKARVEEKRAELDNSTTTDDYSTELPSKPLFFYKSNHGKDKKLRGTNEISKDNSGGDNNQVVGNENENSDLTVTSTSDDQTNSRNEGRSKSSSSSRKNLSSSEILRNDSMPGHRKEASDLLEIGSHSESEATVSNNNQTIDQSKNKLEKKLPSKIPIAIADSVNDGGIKKANSSEALNKETQRHSKEIIIIHDEDSDGINERLAQVMKMNKDAIVNKTNEKEMDPESMMNHSKQLKSMSSDQHVKSPRIHEIDNTKMEKSDNFTVEKPINSRLQHDADVNGIPNSKTQATKKEELNDQKSATSSRHDGNKNPSQLDGDQDVNSYTTDSLRQPLNTKLSQIPKEETSYSPEVNNGNIRQLPTSLSTQKDSVDSKQTKITTKDAKDAIKQDKKAKNSASDALDNSESLSELEDKKSADYLNKEKLPRGKSDNPMKTAKKKASKENEMNPSSLEVNNGKKGKEHSQLKAQNAKENLKNKKLLSNASIGNNKEVMEDSKEMNRFDSAKGFDSSKVINQPTFKMPDGDRKSKKRDSHLTKSDGQTESESNSNENFEGTKKIALLNLTNPFETNPKQGDKNLVNDPKRPIENVSDGKKSKRGKGLFAPSQSDDSQSESEGNSNENVKNENAKQNKNVEGTKKIDLLNSTNPFETKRKQGGTNLGNDPKRPIENVSDEKKSKRGKGLFTPSQSDESQSDSENNSKGHVKHANMEDTKKIDLLKNVTENTTNPFSISSKQGSRNLGDNTRRPIENVGNGKSKKRNGDFASSKSGGSQSESESNSKGKFANKKFSPGTKLNDDNNGLSREDDLLNSALEKDDKNSLSVKKIEGKAKINNGDFQSEKSDQSPSSESEGNPEHNFKKKRLSPDSKWNENIGASKEINPFDTSSKQEIRLENDTKNPFDKFGDKKSNRKNGDLLSTKTRNGNSQSQSGNISEDNFDSEKSSPREKRNEDIHQGFDKTDPLNSTKEEANPFAISSKKEKPFLQENQEKKSPSVNIIGVHENAETANRASKPEKLDSQSEPETSVRGYISSPKGIEKQLKMVKNLASPSSRQGKALNEDIRHPFLTTGDDDDAKIGNGHSLSSKTDSHSESDGNSKSSFNKDNKLRLNANHDKEGVVGALKGNDQFNPLQNPPLPRNSTFDNETKQDPCFKLNDDQNLQKDKRDSTSLRGENSLSDSDYFGPDLKKTNLINSKGQENSLLPIKLTEESSSLQKMKPISESPKVTSKLPSPKPVFSEAKKQRYSGSSTDPEFLTDSDGKVQDPKRYSLSRSIDSNEEEKPIGLSPPNSAHPFIDNAKSPKRTGLKLPMEPKQRAAANEGNFFGTKPLDEQSLMGNTKKQQSPVANWLANQKDSKTDSLDSLDSLSELGNEEKKVEQKNKKISDKPGSYASATRTPGTSQGEESDKGFPPERSPKEKVLSSPKMKENPSFSDNKNDDQQVSSVEHSSGETDLQYKPIMSQSKQPQANNHESNGKSATSFGKGSRLPLPEKRNSASPDDWLSPLDKLLKKNKRFPSQSGGLDDENRSISSVSQNSSKSISLMSLESGAEDTPEVIRQRRSPMPTASPTLMSTSPSKLPLPTGQLQSNPPQAPQRNKRRSVAGEGGKEEEEEGKSITTTPRSMVPAPVENHLYQRRYLDSSFETLYDVKPKFKFPGVLPLPDSDLFYDGMDESDSASTSLSLDIRGGVGGGLPSIEEDTVSSTSASSWEGHRRPHLENGDDLIPPMLIMTDEDDDHIDSKRFSSLLSNEALNFGYKLVHS